LTIASGLIVVTDTWHTVDTEGDAPSDNLAGAYGSHEGSLLLISPADDARTIVVKHNDVAEGVDGTRFFMADNADASMSNLDDAMLFVWRGDLDSGSGGWQEVASNAIRAVRESGGPTDLVLGAIADGEFLKRSGATVVGSTGATGTTDEGLFQVTFYDQSTYYSVSPGTSYADILTDNKGRIDFAKQTVTYARVIVTAIAAYSGTAGTAGIRVCDSANAEVCKLEWAVPATQNASVDAAAGDWAAVSKTSDEILHLEAKAPASLRIYDIIMEVRAEVNTAFLDHHARHQSGGADEVATATPAANAIPKAGADGKLAEGWHPTIASGDLHTEYQKESEKGVASGYASLDANTKVVEDPANVTAVPTAFKIPRANAYGKLASGWITEVLAYADLTDDPLAVAFFKALTAQTLVATDDIEVTDGTPYTPIQSASAITLTSQPTIAAGRNGQIAYIANVGGYNITVQDVNALGGSLLRLTANTLTIQPGGTLVMRYDSAIGFWIEVSILNPQSFTPSISSFTMDGFSSAIHEVGGASSPESPSTHNFALTYVGTPSSCSIDIDGGEINPSDYPVTLVSPYTSYSGAPNFYRATAIAGTRVLTASATVAGQAKTKTVTVTYYNSRYAGINTQATLLSSAQVVALGILATDNAFNSGSKSGLAATGLNYIWYCYRSALGSSGLYFGVNWKGDGIERASFTQIGSQSVTNASGFVETFYEYRSGVQGINSLPGAAGTSTLYLAGSAYYNRIYMGPDASTDPIPTANIRALDDTASGTSKIASTVAGSYTVTIGAGKYLWFCHPAAISDLATIKDHSTGFGIAGSYRTNVSHTNDLGYVETYRCWRSDNPNIFPSGGTVDVT
jgi:hypothetical protein